MDKKINADSLSALENALLETEALSAQHEERSVRNLKVEDPLYLLEIIDMLVHLLMKRAEEEQLGPMPSSLFSL
jgi:hypothetical protein